MSSSVCVSAGGAHLFVSPPVKSISTCDNEPVDRLHDITVTICCVKKPGVHTVMWQAQLTV